MTSPIDRTSLFRRRGGGARQIHCERQFRATRWRIGGLLLCLLCTLPALTAHLVGVPAVATHHLKALVWNVLRDGDEDWRDEVARAEHLREYFRE